MLIKPEYALSKKTNQLVHILDVENGLSCDCICVTCGEDLIAKNKGEIKTPHFSHKSDSNCTSQETYLHFLTKIVFTEIKSFFLPKIDPKIMGKWDYIGDCFHSSKNYELGEQYSIENIRLEQRENEIIPDIKADIVIDNNKYPFIIEIAVTHFCEEKKINFIRNNNLNCIEIDFSDLKKDKLLWNKDFIKKALNDIKRIKFINQNIYTISDIEKRVFSEFMTHQENIVNKIEHLKRQILKTFIYLPKQENDNFQFYVHNIISHASKPNIFAIENKDGKTVIVMLQTDYQNYKPIIAEFIPYKQSDLIIFLCRNLNYISPSLFASPSSSHHCWRKFTY